MALQECARGVGTINLEALVVSVVGIYEAQVMEQRRDIQQFRIEFEI